MQKNLACFISAHGFGHAARTTAILACLLERIPDLHAHLFTAVPAWFFSDSLDGRITVHPVQVDVGLSQRTAMDEDLADTLRRLDEYLPFPQARLDSLTEQITQAGCTAVLCDISPLGIAVAHQAGLPSILVENFTWDWIYAGYLPQEPGFSRFLPLLRAAFSLADYHIQTRPFCAPAERVDRIVSPVSRMPRQSRAAVRRRLELSEDEAVVLVTMGGIQEKYAFLERLVERPEIAFVIPGSVEQATYRDNLRLLPHHSDFYHPDLLNACDAVVGKVGYSTLAETYQAGLPFGYLTRQRMAESACLEGFIQEEMRGLHIPTSEFESGKWIDRLPALLALGKLDRHEENGAEHAAAFIQSILE